jgi:two-component system response regulator AtoC
MDSSTSIPPSGFGATEKSTSTVDAGATVQDGVAPAGGDVLSDDCVFLAVSPAMLEVRRQVIEIAGTDAPVLLLGETGTGKEVLAKLIHKFSDRSQRTFMKVNCAALPAELLESELFGHEAGAFTGATRSKPGKFEVCHRGTLLLDEIAEMPIVPQAKLLHVLQDGEFARLGSPSPIRVDVRMIAATNVDIPQAIAAQKFRKDLYYRLSVFSVRIPPLRERPEDIPPLLKRAIEVYVTRKYSRRAEGFSSERLKEAVAKWTIPPQRLLDACLSYDWPGNVRELETIARRYVTWGKVDKVLEELEVSRYGENRLIRTEVRKDFTYPSVDLRKWMEGQILGLDARVRLMQKQIEALAKKGRSNSRTRA